MGKQAQGAWVTCPRSPRFIFHSSSLCTPHATAIYPAILSSERCQVCVSGSGEEECVLVRVGAERHLAN